MAHGGGWTAGLGEGVIREFGMDMCCCSLLGSYNKHRSFLHHNPESADQLYSWWPSRPKIGLVTVLFLQHLREAEEVWTDGTHWSLQQPLTDSLHPP